NISAAMAAASNADFVVVVAGLTPFDEGEDGNGSGDRSSLSLDGKDAGRNYGMLQNTLITQIASLGKPMVVVLEGGSAIDLPWLASVPAVVMAWYPGQVGGRALGKLLFGDENFSGKLPLTWPTGASQLMALSEGATANMDYFVGYRRFDQMDLVPLYPFGYGNSYSTFSYSNLQVPCGDVTVNGVVNVTVDVQNTSPRRGDEIVMLFVSHPTTTDPRHAKRDLKGFARVTLEPAGMQNATRRVTISLRVQDLKFWDAASNGWQVQRGQYTIMVGPNACPIGNPTDKPAACPATNRTLTDYFTVK